MEGYGIGIKRRLFDARFDFSPRRSNIADEAERAIVMRLADGTPQQFLILWTNGWRFKLTPVERDDKMAMMWYQAIEKLLTNPTTLSELKLKADFYRNQWQTLPLMQRLEFSRSTWIDNMLAKHNKEKLNDLNSEGLVNTFPVSKDLGDKFSSFERRRNREEKFAKAAQQTYFEITQPEAAEFVRKRAAEALAEEKAAAERARVAALAAEDMAVRTKLAEAAANQMTLGQMAFHESQEDAYQKRKEDAARIKKWKGKGPVVWDWERDSSGKATVEGTPKLTDEMPAKGEEKFPGKPTVLGHGSSAGPFIRL